jgi:hypothetical protein
MKKEIKNNKIIESAKSGTKKSIKMVHTATSGLYKKSPKIFLGALVILLAVGGYMYFKKSEAKKETHIVARGSLEEAVSVTGKIKASTDADLSKKAKRSTLDKLLPCYREEPTMGRCSKLELEFRRLWRS